MHVAALVQWEVSSLIDWTHTPAHTDQDEWMTQSSWSVCSDNATSTLRGSAVPHAHDQSIDDTCVRLHTLSEWNIILVCCCFSDDIHNIVDNVCTSVLASTHEHELMSNYEQLIAADVNMDEQTGGSARWQPLLEGAVWTAVLGH